MSSSRADPAAFGRHDVLLTAAAEIDRWSALRCQFRRAHPCASKIAFVPPAAPTEPKRPKAA